MGGPALPRAARAVQGEAVERMAKARVLPAVLALREAMAARQGLGRAAAVVERPRPEQRAVATEQMAALAATSYQHGRLQPLLETAVITQVEVALATQLELTAPQLGLEALAAVGMAGIKPPAAAVAAAEMATILVLRRGQLIPAVAAGRTLTIHRQEQARQEDLESSLSGILEGPVPLAGR